MSTCGPASTTDTDSVENKIMKNSLFLSLSTGVCGQPEQDTAHPRHPAEEPDQTHRVSEQVPKRQDRRRTVQR